MPSTAVPSTAVPPIRMARNHTAGHQYSDCQKPEHELFHAPILLMGREKLITPLNKTNVPPQSFAPGQRNLLLGRVETARKRL
jgi:hypothetical protein